MDSGGPGLFRDHGVGGRPARRHVQLHQQAARQVPHEERPPQSQIH